MDRDKIKFFRKQLRKFDRLNQIMNTTCCRNVTLAQCHTLLEIEELGSTTALQLTKNLKLDKSTLSRTIEPLVKKRLVKREMHDNDRRFTLLSLTDEGKKVCDNINHANNNYFRTAFNTIPANKRTEVINSFSTLVQAIETYHINFSSQNNCCD